VCRDAPEVCLWHGKSAKSPDAATARLVRVHNRSDPDSRCVKLPSAAAKIGGNVAERYRKAVTGLTLSGVSSLLLTAFSTEGPCLGYPETGFSVSRWREKPCRRILSINTVRFVTSRAAAPRAPPMSQLLLECLQNVLLFGFGKGHKLTSNRSR
jgi:hypothetical protein